MLILDNIEGSFSFVSLLKACGKKKDIQKGIKLHGEIVKKGLLGKCPYVATTLISMYAKCGEFSKAHQVFEELPTRTTYSWNALLSLYAQQGQGHEALQCLEAMQRDGFTPDSVSFTCILKACGNTGCVDKGNNIHTEISDRGLLKKDIVLGNGLIDMYARCGSLDEACKSFHELQTRNIVSYGAMIAGYAKHDRCMEALCLYRRMACDGILPNEVTFVSALNACSGIGDLEEGKLVFMDMKRSGIKPNIFMENACIDMFVKCGSFRDAWQIFMNMAERDVITWTTIIAGCAQQGYSDKALSLIQQMKQEGLEPGDVSLVSNFNAFASLGSLEHARTMHALVLQFLNKSNDFVGSALVDMYIKCKSIDDAKQAFCQLPKKDIILWNAMLSGYIVDGNVGESIELLQQMDDVKMVPNNATFTIVLNTCANMGALEHGKYIHGRVAKVGLVSDTFIGCALVNMYTKCGIIQEAEHVFYNIPMRDMVLYTSMIAGYAQHSEGHAAVNLTNEMWKDGLTPNHVTFVGVLSACSHAGLIEEAISQFDHMYHFFKIKPITEHFVCMVDLLGRAGCLDEAELYINKLTCKPSAMVWRALLGACRTFNDRDRAKCIAKCIIELQPDDEGAFVLFSNICGAAVNAYDD